MFPKQHVITSALPVFLLALYLRLPTYETAAWAVIGAAATVLIDLDHLAIQLMMPGRRATVLDIIQHPLRHTDVRVLQRRLHYPGFGILRMKVHLAEVLAVSLIFLHLRPPYSVPILLSLLIHCVMDLYEMITKPDSR